MNAFRHSRGFVGVAGDTFHFRDFRRVRVILDRSVAIGASENAVNTGRVLGSIHHNISARGRSHPRLAVASQAVFVLLIGRLREYRCQR